MDSPITPPCAHPLRSSEIDAVAHSSSVCRWSLRAKTLLDQNRPSASRATPRPRRPTCTSQRGSLPTQGGDGGDVRSIVSVESGPQLGLLQLNPRMSARIWWEGGGLSPCFRHSRGVVVDRSLIPMRMTMDNDIGGARNVFLSNVRSAVSRTIRGAAGDICPFAIHALAS